MTADRLVSLVMPAWRARRDWLLEAVASALGQRGCNVELIVVDDGSEEPVADLLADVDQTRLRLVRVEHGGVSHARNAGLSVAAGAWIRYVDCDDVIDPDSTAHLLELAGAGDVLAYGATVWCDSELRPGSTMTSDVRGNAVEACLLDRFEVTLPTILFPRWVVDAVGAWDTEIVVCQDWDYMLRAFELAPVRGDDRVALLYRRHVNGASAGTLGSPESVRLGEQGMRLVVDRYFERHPEQRDTELERRARATVELVMARSYREAYLAHLGRAFRGHPRGVIRELGAVVRILVHKARTRLRRARERESHA